MMETSYINSIPVELLCTIISIVIHADEPRARDKDILYTLRFVDRYWRSVVDSNPLFWTSIIIDKSFEEDEEEECIDDPDDPALCAIPSTVQPSDVFPSIAFALTRSLSLPIDIIITLPDVLRPRFYGEHARKLGQLLLPHAHRIRSLDVGSPEWILHLELLSPFSNICLPVLERFTHTVCEQQDLSASDTYEGFIEPHQEASPILQYPYPANDSATINLWGRTLYPSLRSIEIMGAPYNWHVLPTAGLAELRVSIQPLEFAISADDLRQLLECAAPTLKQLEISNALEHPEMAPVDVEPINLPVLHTLALAYDCPDEVAFSLPLIRAPALKQLGLSDRSGQIGDDSAIPTDAFLLALMESLPVDKLESLELDKVTFCDELPIPTTTELMHEELQDSLNLPMSLRFLRCLKELKHLNISTPPDAAIWDYLNFPARPHFAKDGINLTGGVMYPNLHMLDTIAVGGTAYEILEFLDTRLGLGRQSKPLTVRVQDSVVYQITAEGWLEMDDMIRRLAWLEPLDEQHREKRLAEAKSKLKDITQRWDAILKDAAEVEADEK